MAFPAAAACDSCGAHRVVSRVIEGVPLGECALCGALHGGDEMVALAELRREGRERGFDPRIYPLVRALERVPTFSVSAADARRPELR